MNQRFVAPAQTAAQFAAAKSGVPACAGTTS